MKIKHAIVSSLIGLAAVIGMPASVMAANPASFSLSTSTTSVLVGNSFSVSVYENGDAVNVVTGKVSFDSTKLQYVSASCGASLPSSIVETNGLTCYTAGGTSVSGSQLAVSMVFKALVSSGSTSITIDPTSKIVAAGVNIWNKSAASVAVSFNAPVVTPPIATPANITKTTQKNTTKPNTTAYSQPATTVSTPVKAKATAKHKSRGEVLGASTTRDVATFAQVGGLQVLSGVILVLAAFTAIAAITITIQESKPAKRIIKANWRNIRKKVQAIF